MRIKFITTAVTHHGTFSTGDIATFDDAFARHCVDDAKCAVHIETPVPVATDEKPSVQSAESGEGEEAPAAKKTTKAKK